MKECLEEAVDKGYSRLLSLYGLHAETKRIDLLVRSRAQQEFWPNRGLRREPIGIYFLTTEHRKAVQWLEPLAELDGSEVMPIASVEEIPHSLARTAIWFYESLPVAPSHPRSCSTRNGDTGSGWSELGMCLRMVFRPSKSGTIGSDAGATTRSLFPASDERASG